MQEASNNLVKKTTDLPPIPSKRYFTIGEVSLLCEVKPHVLRYWEQEFPQLKPSKRRGNRRYYQQHDVELIREIRELLYHQGFTIAGARQQLSQKPGAKRAAKQTQPKKPEELVQTLRGELEDVLEMLAE